MRRLKQADRDDLLALCARHPVVNLFVASRVLQYGIEPATLGCPILGFFRDGELLAALHVGANIVPVEADEDALRAFADELGPVRSSNSIMGDADQVNRLYRMLALRWGSIWETARELRMAQPLMIMDRDPVTPIDPRLRPVGLAEFDAYFDASVRMYTEEVGVSPLIGDSHGYRVHVRRAVEEGRALGIVIGDRVVYKSDLATLTNQACQVQGVWLDPAYRGRGLSIPAMAAVVAEARRRCPIVSLYVNDFNTVARALYRRVGFVEVGQFATVLY